MALLSAGTGCGPITTDLGAQGASMEAGAPGDGRPVVDAVDGSGGSVDAAIAGCSQTSPAQPMTFVSGGYEYDLAIGQGQLYWIGTVENSSTGQYSGIGLLRAAADTGTPQVVVGPSRGLESGSQLVFFSGSLYWRNASDVSTAQDALGVYSFDPLGSAPPVQIVHETGATCASGFAVDGTGVYYSDHCSGTIATASLTGAAPRVLYTNTASKPSALALDPAFVYFGAWDGINRMKRDGSSVSKLVPVEANDEATALAVDETSVYWIAKWDGSLKKANLDGSERASLYQGPVVSEGSGAALVLDGAFVYLTKGNNVGPLTILKVPKAGGCPVTLATVPYAKIFSVSLAVDDAFVYWDEGGDLVRSIRRVPK